MKLFTKLALVSAVAISSNAMAMQAMDDAALSATTGQDGISIGIGISKVQIDKVHVFDGDGLASGYTDTVNLTGGNPTVYAAGSGHAGAITVNNVVLSAPLPTETTRLLGTHNLADITIDTDGGAGHPFLNVGAAVSGLNISLGKIEVNDASGLPGAYKVGDGAATPTVASAEILSGLTLKTGVMSANIQLGNTPQGAMIKLNGVMTGGLEINDLALKDASTAGGGYIAIGGIKLNDTDSTTGGLSLNADIAVTKKGLAITAMKSATDIYITKVVLGGGDGFVPKSGTTAATPGTGVGSASIGDIAISGLKVWNGAAGYGAGTPNGAVITISGH
ncbi:DUF6160 family protein [uncultured Acinetobacter sp.]|uniref:putative pilus system protein FilA n=1 Tax=uncultured Acinetobacter sp. TaxID=165433 RepID=UPI0025E152C9|nr:DUF6160 family protein [uncultured Acinetobacter sp.]